MIVYDCILLYMIVCDCICICIFRYILRHIVHGSHNTYTNMYFIIGIYTMLINILYPSIPFPVGGLGAVTKKNEIGHTPNRESQCTVSLKHKSPWDAAHSGSQRSQCNLM